MLGDVVEVVPRGEPEELSAFGVDDSECAVVEGDVVRRVDQAHRVGAVRIGLGGHELDVLGVAEDDLPEGVQGEQPKLDGARCRRRGLALELGRERPRDAAGEPEDGMDGLAGHRTDQLAELLADADHFLADLEPDGGDDAEDVPLRLWRVRPDDEVRSAEEEEMQRVVLDHEGAVDELADLLGGRRRLDLVEVIEGLRRGHVVGHRTDPADTGSDLRHILGSSALGELFEAAQLRDLEVGALDVAVGVEEDVDPPVPLETCQGVDEDLASHGTFSSTRAATRWCSSEAGRL